MSNKSKINKSLVLAYLSGQMDEANSLVEDLLGKLLDSIKLPEANFALDDEREIYTSIIGLIRDVMSAAKSISYSSDRILDELKLICGDSYMNIYLSIKESFPADKDSQQDKRKRMMQEINSVSRILREQEIRSIITGAHIAISSGSSESLSTFDDFVENIVTRLSETQLNTGKSDSAIQNDILFEGDRAEVEEVFEKHLDLEDDRTTWKLNWKEVNVALQGGGRNGDTWLIGAMQHNYKSAFTMSIFRGLARYNKAATFKRDNDKKPTLSRMSFEDSMTLNMSFLALNILWNRNFKEGNNSVPDTSVLSKEQLTDLVIDDMSDNGWQIHMLKCDGDSWGYKDIIRKNLSLEADGYDIRAQVLDYLFMVSKKGLEQGSTGADVRNLLRKMRGHYSSKEIFGITPCQLSPGVKRLISDGVVDKKDLLPHIKDLGMFSESSKLSEEPEIVSYLNKFKIGEITYLHLLFEKHRFSRSLPNENLKSFYFTFPTNGMSIPDDPEGKLGVVSYRLPVEAGGYY